MQHLTADQVEIIALCSSDILNLFVAGAVCEQDEDGPGQYLPGDRGRANGGPPSQVRSECRQYKWVSKQFPPFLSPQTRMYKSYNRQPIGFWLRDRGSIKLLILLTLGQTAYATIIIMYNKCASRSDSRSASKLSFQYDWLDS